MKTFDAEYCTFPRAWDREGRDAVGFENTYNYSMSVLHKWMHGELFHGHAYYTWCPDRKAAMMLHIRRKVQVGSGTEWTLKESESTVAPGGGGSSSHPEPIAATPVKELSPAELRKKRKAEEQAAKEEEAKKLKAEELAVKKDSR